MLSDLKSGLTYVQIGMKHSISRQRVHRLICGASLLRSKRKLGRKRQRKLDRIFRNYKCTPEAYSAIMQGSSYSENNLAGKYTAHRRSAALRNILFEISFPEWYQVWKDSGHLSSRGRTKGSYVMCRLGDNGPYKVGNVEIKLTSDNIHDGYLNRGVRVSTKHKVKNKDGI